MARLEADQTRCTRSERLLMITRRTPMSSCEILLEAWLSHRVATTGGWKFNHQPGRLSHVNGWIAAPTRLARRRSTSATVHLGRDCSRLVRSWSRWTPVPAAESRRPAVRGPHER